MLVWSRLVVSALIAAVGTGDYVPGTPGGPWTQDELLVVKSKLYNRFRVGFAPRALRLSFHDCIKYMDGTGGCDGCLNWHGDVWLNGVAGAKNSSNIDHGDNNGLGVIIIELEKIYTDKNYPDDAQKLPMSLKESGKSRADLWSYAAIVAVEYGIDTNNLACTDLSNPRLIGHNCPHEPNTTQCFVKPTRPIQFQYGRSDCVSLNDTHPYITDKEEHHPNPVADGRATIEYFKQDFGFTGRETCAIMGAHTFGHPKFENSLFPYVWTSLAVSSFNNEYYKNIVGLDKWYMDDEIECRPTGDAYGKKPETRWLAHTRKVTERGGPVFWIHQNHVCPSLYRPDKWSEKDIKCMNEAQAGQSCKPDPPEGSTSPRNPDQADADPHDGCEKWRLISGGDEIALNAEMGLYRDFKITDGIIHGCPGLEHFNASMADNTTYDVWSSILDERGWQQPRCEKQMLAEPPGSTPLYLIMEEYAYDQTQWVDDFTVTFEKMMRNGYPEGLTNGPDIHTNLVCPMPIRGQPAYSECYIRNPVGNGPVFMLGSAFDILEGKVYQYNEKFGVFDFGLPTYESNQMWKMSESNNLVYNMKTGDPLIVQGAAYFKMEWIDNDGFFLVSQTDNNVIDCWTAIAEGEPCILYQRHGGPNQVFRNFFAFNL